VNCGATWWQGERMGSATLCCLYLSLHCGMCSVPDHAEIAVVDVGQSFL
jgi:hypothetical protein